MTADRTADGSPRIAQTESHAPCGRVFVPSEHLRSRLVRVGILRALTQFHHSLDSLKLPVTHLHDRDTAQSHEPFRPLPQPAGPPSHGLSRKFPCWKRRYGSQRGPAPNGIAVSGLQRSFPANEGKGYSEPRKSLYVWPFMQARVWTRSPFSSSLRQRRAGFTQPRMMNQSFADGSGAGNQKGSIANRSQTPAFTGP